MASRKRGRFEMEADEPLPPLSLLKRLRNFWVFSNLMQFIYLFGAALHVEEDFDIEVRLQHGVGYCCTPQDG
jgi:hypothetical protein